MFDRSALPLTRSLQRVEYKWMKDYAVRAERAALPTETPDLQDVLSHLWGFILGCPQDSESAQPTGCQDSQTYGRGSVA